MAFLSIGSDRVKNDYICRGYDIPYEPNSREADRKLESGLVYLINSKSIIIMILIYLYSHN